MNRTVWAPPLRRLRRAVSITARTSLTPALSADIATNRRSVAPATRCAMVVLPEPGGPHRITDSGAWPETSCRSGAPGASRWSWPTSSSTVRGRIRTASGASPAGGVNEAASRPESARGAALPMSKSPISSTAPRLPVRSVSPDRAGRRTSRLLPVAYPRLGEKVVHLRLHRRLADHQRHRDLGVGQAGRDQPQHVALPVGQPVRRRTVEHRGRCRQQVQQPTLDVPDDWTTRADRVWARNPLAGGPSPS